MRDGGGYIAGGLIRSWILNRFKLCVTNNLPKETFTVNTNAYFKEPD